MKNKEIVVNNCTIEMKLCVQFCVKIINIYKEHAREKERECLDSRMSNLRVLCKMQISFRERTKNPENIC